jgi:hypothetical protein
MCALRTMLVEDEFHTCLCGTLVISLLAFFAPMNEASPAQSDWQVCSRTALGYLYDAAEARSEETKSENENLETR